MGYSNTFIAIKGTHVERAKEIFGIFNYIDNGNDKIFADWSKASRFLLENYFEYANKDISLRGIWVDNGWTIICDPEMVDITNDDKLEKLSEMLRSEVWTFLIQSTSGTYAFAKFNPLKVRSFFASDGKVIGDSDPASNPFKNPRRLTPDDIFLVAKKLGITLDASELRTNFVVKAMPYDETIKEMLARFKETPAGKKFLEKKPWWRLW
jgi:hypothetical protein